MRALSGPPPHLVNIRYSDVISRTVNHRAKLPAVAPSPIGWIETIASGLINTTYQVGSAAGLAVMVALAAWVAPHGGTGTADLLPGFQTAFFGAAVAAFLGTAATVVLVQRPPPASVHNKALLAWSLTFQCTAAIDRVPNVFPVKQAEPHPAALECSTSTMTAKTLDAIRSPGPF